MRIVHLASEFPPARIYGLGRYVHDLARAQVRRGHEVHVFTNSASGRDEEIEIHGIRVHRIRFPSPPKPADGATQVVQFNLCLYERLVERESRVRPADAVVAHDWLTILAAHRAQRRIGGHLVLTVHDTAIGKTFGKMTDEDKFIAQVERWGTRAADAIVAVSAAVKEELRTIYEALPEKLHVVPCAVDPEWFRDVEGLRAALAAPEEKIVAYVGRLDPEKGIETLVESFADLAPRYPAVRLVIAGKGSEQARLEKLAERKGVAERIRFLGYVTGPALAALYRASDLLVCPSRYEPFGIVPLEGMANRLPVIASDVGGMAEIVEDGKSGLKVPPGDVVALSRAISFVLDRPDEARKLAEAGYERARQVYNWDRVAEQVEPIYMPRRKPKLTAGIRVKNGEPFAEECLRELSPFVDEIVILDDGSTDRTIEICRAFPKVTQIVRWEKDFFHEGIDRNVVLALVKNTSPDWILLPDIDEIFEERFKSEVERMMADPEVGLYAFPFCHFWRSRTHYRVDGKWGRETREFPIPRLVRNVPSLHYPVDKPLGTAQIRGFRGRTVVSAIRVKHYGHLYEEISRSKVAVYSRLDPGTNYSYMIDESGLQLQEWKESP